MGVKTIFKALIGTMTIMITSFFIIEYYNISVASPQLKTMTQVALRQSCQFFAQESYKSGNGSGNAYQIQGNGFSDATLSGQFYLSSPEATYNKLYKNSSDFKQYITDVRNTLHSKTWRNLHLLGYAMGMGTGSGDSLKAGEETLAKYYLEDMLTPLNIGIVYLDRETVTKIFRWELVNILMNGQNEMIIQENADNPDTNYVLYKGFRVYYNTIKVTGINYEIYNLIDTESAKKFEELTNIDVEEYLSHSNILAGDERQYVTVATLDYSMRVGYEGITPVKRAFQWAFNRESDSDNKYVAGDPINSVRGREENSWQQNGIVGGETSLSAVGAHNADMVDSNLDNFNNSSGAYTLDNTIIYYIVR